MEPFDEDKNLMDILLVPMKYNVLSVPIKYIDPSQKYEPSHGSANAAGYDLYARSAGPTIIAPHTCVPIHTGVSIALPEGTFGGIFPRSGLATKKGLRLANSVGVIDADYRGEIIVAIYNDSDSTQIIESGERIAQIIVMPCFPVVFEEVEELDDTVRGAGGFGSTGEK